MKIVILGATSVAGREIIELLGEEPALRKRRIIACAGQKSKGKQISFGNSTIACEDFSGVDIEENDIVISAAKESFLLSVYKDIAQRGGVVIDVFGFLSGLKGAPLVISEINPDEIAAYVEHRVVSSPSPIAIQTILSVFSLHKKYGIKRMVISTYEAVSSKGKRGMDELYNQTKKMFEASSHPSVEFPKQIAFNCIPQTGEFLEDGSTREEAEAQAQIKRFIGEDVGIAITCVNTPVFNCHAESINLEFEKESDEDGVKESLFNDEFLLFFEKSKDGAFKTQIECSKEDAVFVSRLRMDSSLKSGVSLWVVADNIRRGSAMNAVKIAKFLESDYLR